MPGQPRKHHFVPSFYLAGFTDSGGKDGKLFVLDQQRLATWPGTPLTVGYEKDFHKIEPGPDGDELAFEKKLADMEGKWSLALQAIIRCRHLNEDDSFGYLMQFVAFMAVRVPRVRKLISNFIDAGTKAGMRAKLASSEGLAHVREWLRESGNELSDDDFQKFVSAVKTEEYVVDFDKTWHVTEILRLALPLSLLLSQRQWTLWFVAEDAPDLFSSDSPVSMTPLVETPGVPLGFRTPNTLLSVPLNRRIALVSMIEMQLPPRTLDRLAVAQLNSATGRFSNQIYSPAPDFVWVMKTGQLGNASDLLAALGPHSSA